MLVYWQCCTTHTLPPQLTDAALAAPDYYDAVVIVGALSEGQVPAEVFLELLRVTKPSEFFFSRRDPTVGETWDKEASSVLTHSFHI